MSSGRRVFLEELVQWRTYLGRLVGIPEPEKMMEQTLIEAGARLPAGSEAVQLIRPQSKAVRHVKTRGRGASTVAILPPVTCAAVLCSHSPARNLDADFSVMTLTWYQEDWALPICPITLRQMLKLDWEALARDAQF